MRAFATLVLVMFGCAVFGQGSISVSVPANGLLYRGPWADSPPKNLPANVGFVSVLWAPAGAAYTPRKSEQNLTQWLLTHPAWKQATSDGLPGGAAFRSPITTEGRLLDTFVSIPTANQVDLILIGWTGNSSSFDAAFVLSDENDPGSCKLGFSNRVLGVTPGASPADPVFVSFDSGLLLSPTPTVPEPGPLALAIWTAGLAWQLRRKPGAVL